MIYLQRHGESETNITGIFSCRTLDPNLTETGKQQAVEKAEFYRDKGITRIVSSPMQRARQTAQAICDVAGLTYEIDNDLYEVNIGTLEGKSEREELWRKAFYDTIGAWVRGENVRFDDGEDYEEVTNRVARIRKRYSADVSDAIVLVGHSAIYAMMIHVITGETDLKKLFLPRCGVYEINV